MQSARSSRSASSSAILRSRSPRHTCDSRVQSRFVGVRSWGSVGQRLADPSQRHPGGAAGLDQRDAAQRAARVAALVALGAVRDDQPLALPEAEGGGRDAAARGQFADGQVGHLTSSVLEVLPSAHACRFRSRSRLSRPPGGRREARAERLLHLHRPARPLRARAAHRCGRPPGAPTATASCCRRATGRRRSTRCWRPAGFFGEEWLRRLRRLRLTARPPPGSQPGARRRDLVRLARARAAAGRRRLAGAAGTGTHRAARLLPGRRRRAGRGLEPRGDRLRGPRRPRRADRDRRRQRVGHARLAGRHRRAVRRSRAGRPRRWTAAMPTRSSTRSRPRIRGHRGRSSPRCGRDRHARALRRRDRRPAGDRPARRRRRGRHRRRAARCGRATGCPAGSSTSASASS